MDVLARWLSRTLEDVNKGKALYNRDPRMIPYVSAFSSGWPAF